MKEAVRIIHDAGIKAAVSVKPKTPVSVLEPVIADLEMVLIMSVEPGFSGQSYHRGLRGQGRSGALRWPAKPATTVFSFKLMAASV